MAQNVQCGKGLQPSEVWGKERTALIRLDQTASVANVITGSLLGHWGDLNVGTMTLLWLCGLFYCGKYELEGLVVAGNGKSINIVAGWEN